MTFYVLKALSWIGIVWDLKSPPKAVQRNEQRLGSRVIDRAAAQLAGSFNLDHIVASITSGTTGPGLRDLQERLADAQHRAEDALASLNLPHLPTRHDILARARQMFPETPSMDDIVNRGHAVILDTIGARLTAIPLTSLADGASQVQPVQTGR